MNVSTKSATIENTGSDEDFPGTFRVVLSTGKKDRDGEEVKRSEWIEPLPDHITFDTDHGMNVESTIGSGTPYFDDQDRLLVDGTYSSLQKAQDVRTLVNEGHIRTTSVTFARHTSTDKKSGAKTVRRELLNGAFVSIPSNTDAVVLGSKAGKRNSATDQENLQNAHDALVAVGATCSPMDDTGAAEGASGGKSYDYTGSLDYDADVAAKSLELRTEWNADVATKALADTDTVSISLSGYTSGFSVSVSTYCAPALEIDAWADTAQNAIAAALGILSGGPDDDDGDSTDDGVTDADAKSLGGGSAAANATQEGSSADEANALLNSRAIAISAMAAAVQFD